MKNSVLFLILTFLASVASAEPPAPAPTHAQSATEALVEEQIIKPLKKVEAKRSRFSRAAPVPLARRVRVLDTVAEKDLNGREFVRFAIDIRRGYDDESEWQKDNITGCAYPSERKVFVRRDDGHVPAKSVLGADVREAPGACTSAPHGSVELAAAAR